MIHVLVHDKDKALTGLATTLLSCLFSYNTSAKCSKRILGHLRDLLAPLRDFLPNDQGLVKLLKVGPRWSEPSDIGCTKL